MGNGWCCFRYRLLLLSWSTIPLALKKGKRLSEQSERINRCDSTATRKALSIRLASHRHQKGVCHLHIIAVLSLPAVGLVLAVIAPIVWLRFLKSEDAQQDAWEEEDRRNREYIIGRQREQSGNYGRHADIR